ncbi:hypothetical protein QYE76_066197 [Lolium multiflorum]|uniref:Protein FAR1-RELATED SEQUENCE n=1 Tax=Lolium multiflorum TaxID=4521 RepID=A0AAD8WBV9_LOLMU|nr:hypothetical protein QYE76_066197 [Lolium multiflorum]
MSISSDDDGIEQQKKSSVELEENQGATQDDVLLEDPELGMTFDTEDDVREYYKNYAKAKGFGVTRRSSNRDDNGELSRPYQELAEELAKAAACGPTACAPPASVQQLSAQASLPVQQHAS